MKRLITALSVIAWTCCVSSGEEVVREISWAQMQNQGKLTVGQVIETNRAAGLEQLKVENPQSESRTFAILSISEPGITSSSYAVTGQVRYEAVEGTGYLEMWNYFSDGGKYFSRTLADSGQMQSLHGSSDWRDFTLPFYIGEATDMRPTKLEFNVVLPGRGTVYLSPLELVQYVSAGGPLLAGRGRAWWDDRTAGVVGGLAGSIVGLVGGVIGLLSGIGKGRRLVLFLLTLLSLIGGVSLVFGLTAVVLSQPYGVYYPPLLLGGICTIVPTGLRGTIRRRFEEIELRKMKAMDVT
ncbi:MAG TPA: hypothetical protein VMW16_14020 [Sedimentisphaerales bacterium]|nr:hypothetical protein [Sedimentisphaerales bacterium]